jgi:anaerobic dimethyl sulfoxide reductase subunit A
MNKGAEKTLSTRLNKASLSRRSFLKWSAAAGATAALASKVDLLDGIYPLKSALAAGEEQIIPTGCAHNCGGRCVLKAHVQDGVVTRITTDTDRPDDPNNPRLIACMRGRAYRRRMYAPDRLTTPLRRVGERGSGEFEEISWEEALDTVANELIRVRDEYGQSAIYSHYSSGSYTEMTGANPTRRLLNMFGGVLGYYNSYSTACTGPATQATYGTTATGNFRTDWQNSKLIIMWAWNPAEMIHGTNTPYMLKLAREAGAKVVVVDPRLSMSVVGLADEWIPIRPGTDCAMMAAMAYVMIDEGLVDEEYINRYAVGYDADHMPEGYEGEENFKDYVLGESDGVPKTPEWAEAITAVPAATIANLAREYATTKPAMLFQGWGVQRRAIGEQPVRFACTLATMTGNIGISGGHASGAAYAYSGEYAPAPSMGIPANAVPYSIPVHSWTDGILRGAEMTREDGVRGLADDEETLPVSIKFVYNPAGNTLVNQHSNINRTIEILKDDTLCEFIVSNEQFMTPSARYSDIILPVCTFMETWGLCSNWTYSPSRILMPKVVDPLYDLPTDYAVASMLAERLGIYDEFTEGGKTEEDWYNEFIEGMVTEYSDIYPDRAALEERGSWTIPYSEDNPLPFADFIADPDENPLNTTSGKVEIFSTAFAEHNATIGDPAYSPAIPKYVQEWESPFGPEAEDYPLQAMGHHYQRRTHSTWDNIDWMEDALPQRIFMNPIDAEARGIATDDEVRIWNQRGTIVMQVRVTPRIMPGLVDIPQGAWFTPDGDGVDRRGAVNMLTNERPTPYSFGNPQHSIMVQVEKA